MSQQGSFYRFRGSEIHHPYVSVGCRPGGFSRLEAGDDAGKLRDDGLRVAWGWDSPGEGTMMLIKVLRNAIAVCQGLAMNARTLGTVPKNVGVAAERVILDLFAIVTWLDNIGEDSPYWDTLEAGFPVALPRNTSPG